MQQGREDPLGLASFIPVSFSVVNSWLQRSKQLSCSVRSRARADGGSSAASARPVSATPASGTRTNLQVMRRSEEAEEAACLSPLLHMTSCIPFLLMCHRCLTQSYGAEQMAPAGLTSSQQGSFPLSTQISARKSSLDLPPLQAYFSTSPRFLSLCFYYL